LTDKEQHPPDGQPSGFDPDSAEPVWTYRGYRLRSGDFNTAMVHFFRAEISRANVWRQRLDATTNWAVISTGAALTVSFGQQIGHHGLIFLTALLVTTFLYIEARRYRYYELWSYRVRLMETDFFAAMLVPPFRPDPDWAESLAENLLHPEFPISLMEAIGRRLRRNYLWIYMILGLAWFVRVAIFPTPTASWEIFLERAALGTISGGIVVIGLLLAGIAIILFSILTVGLHSASGEILPRYMAEGQPLFGHLTDSNWRKWFRPSRKRKQLLALIITDVAEAIGLEILREMSRGATAMPGKGMYTGAEHTVLLCAVTVTEVNQLKSIVNRLDPKAFVIVAPAQEIIGRGFEPLKV
jgi:uncharacterized membrane protein